MCNRDRSSTLHDVRGNRGQAAAEYMGVLLVVAAIIAALFATQIPSKIGCALSSSVAQIAGADDPGTCGEDGTATAGGRDGDGDGVPDSVEQSNGTDPKNADSDGDGLSDGDEVKHGSDPNNVDTDGDGVPDDEEATLGTSPIVADSDADGIDDKEEIERGSNPRNPDTDGDGLDDGAELDAGTDPFEKDTDGDGQLDGEDDDPTAYSAWPMRCRRRRDLRRRHVLEVPGRRRPGPGEPRVLLRPDPHRDLRGRRHPGLRRRDSPRQVGRRGLGGRRRRPRRG